MIKKLKKHLFLIDLDGTLLKDSTTGEVSNEDIKAIQRATKDGHVVCIATGRPWRSTAKAYKACGIKTVVANYNGAQIHNPSDYNFIPVITYMNLNDVMYVLGDKKVQEIASNIAFEGPSWVMVKKRDKDLERVFGFKDAAKFRVGLDFHRLPLRPTGVIFDTKKGVNVAKVKDYLQRTYGDLMEFSSWSKGEGLTPVFDMTAVGVTKAKALSYMARYYDIPMNRTIAIGDGYNDVPMFEVAEYSSAMGQSSQDIKNKATYSAKGTNKQNGVSEFINKFLDNKDGKFQKELSKKRSEMKCFKDETVIAH